MNYFSNNKVWPIIVGLLIIVNTATLAFFWVSAKGKPFGKRGEEGNAAVFIEKELQLDTAQKLAFKALREQHHQEMNALKKEIKEAKDSFYNLLRIPNVSDSVVKAYSLKSAMIEQQVDVLNFKHFQQLRNLCNAKQKEKFDGMIQQVIKMIAPQRPPMPKGGRPHPRPPMEGGEEGPPPPPRDGEEPLGPPPPRD